MAADISRDEALLVLNDRLGQEVEVVLRAAMNPNHTSIVLDERGVLHHWHQDADLANAWSGHPRDDMAGSYSLDERTILDVIDLHTARVLADDDERYTLAFELADGVQLELRWLKDGEGV